MIRLILAHGEDEKNKRRKNVKASKSKSERVQMKGKIKRKNRKLGANNKKNRKTYGSPSNVRKKSVMGQVEVYEKEKRKSIKTTNIFVCVGQRFNMNIG